MVRLRGSVIHYTYESPYKNRGTMCVCVQIFNLILKHTYTHWHTLNHRGKHEGYIDLSHGCNCKSPHSSTFSPFPQHQLPPSSIHGTLIQPFLFLLAHFGFFLLPPLSGSSCVHFYFWSQLFHPSVLPPPPPLTRFPSAPVIFTINHNISYAHSNALLGCQQTHSFKRLPIVFCIVMF